VQQCNLLEKLTTFIVDIFKFEIIPPTSGYNTECYPLVCFIDKDNPLQYPINVSLSLFTSYANGDIYSYNPQKPPLITKYNWTASREYLNSPNRITNNVIINWIDINADGSGFSDVGNIDIDNATLLLVPFNDTN
jgi:hypothetical protein